MAAKSNQVVCRRHFNYYSRHNYLVTWQERLWFTGRKCKSICLVTVHSCCRRRSTTIREAPNQKMTPIPLLRFYDTQNKSSASAEISDRVELQCTQKDTISWATFELVCRGRWAGISTQAWQPSVPCPSLYDSRLRSSRRITAIMCDAEEIQLLQILLKLHPSNWHSCYKSAKPWYFSGLFSGPIFTIRNWLDNDLRQTKGRILVIE